MISKIDCRLFIEGIQIPFNSISINSAINQSSTCTIDVAPSEFVKNLLARSHILIVFLEDKIWRVLWDGELRGWGMSKSSGAISMQISAMDYSNAFGFMTKSIVDNINAQTATYAIFHTGAEFDFAARGGATFADKINKFFGEESSKFSDLMVSIIKEVFSVPYFSYYNEKNKFLDRIISLQDDQIESLLRNTVAVDYMTGIIQNRFIGNVSFDQILNYFLDVAGYCRVPMVAPSKLNGVSPVMLMKPLAYFSTPPVCNCLFPDMYHTISGLGVDYLTEPTRIILKAQETPTVAGENGFTPLWFFNESNPKDPNFGSNSELMNSFLSEDEVNKGILCFDKSISYEKTLNIKRNDGDFDSMKSSMQGYAYYEYVMAKYSHRSCQVSCIFHPFAVVGFPGAIFDAHQSLFGMIDSISHVISADGHAATTISFSHVYPADRTETSTDRGILFSPPLPKWISQGYKPRGCDATYKELFGANSTGHSALGGNNIKSPNKPTINEKDDPKYIFDSDQVNIAEIASSVFGIPKVIDSKDDIVDAPPLYSGANANADFAYEYTRREVISLSEYMTAMNIGSATDESLFNLPTSLSLNAEIYKHPVSFTYDGEKYIASREAVARRQRFAILLQEDLINVTGKLGK